MGDPDQREDFDAETTVLWESGMVVCVVRRYQVAPAFEIRVLVGDSLIESRFFNNDGSASALALEQIARYVPQTQR